MVKESKKEQEHVLAIKLVVKADRKKLIVVMVQIVHFMVIFYFVMTSFMDNNQKF